MWIRRVLFAGVYFGLRLAMQPKGLRAVVIVWQSITRTNSKGKIILTGKVVMKKEFVRFVVSIFLLQKALRRFIVLHNALIPFYQRGIRAVRVGAQSHQVIPTVKLAHQNVFIESVSIVGKRFRKDGYIAKPVRLSVNPQSKHPVRFVVNYFRIGIKSLGIFVQEPVI